MLIDYEHDKYIIGDYGKQPASTLKNPPIFESNDLDFDKIVDEVMLRLYRCDIAHVWLSGCKVYVDIKIPTIDGGKHPSSDDALTIHPGIMVGNGRLYFIKYLIETHIMNNFDNIITNFADDLLFDLYRYGKCDMRRIERDWMDNYGRQYFTDIRVVNISEMPENNRVDWAKSMIKKLLMPSKTALTKKQELRDQEKKIKRKTLKK